MKRFSSNQISEIANAILTGKAAIVPTDTVMGIVSTNFAQIAKIKRRDLTKKQVIFISNLNPLVPIRNKLLRGLINTFWPGKLTIVIGGISYRMPNSIFLLNLVSLTGNLYSSSANLADQPPVETYEEAQKAFADSLEQLIYVDDQLVGSRTPSTIVDLDRMEIIREGELVNHPAFQKLIKKFNLRKPV